MESRVLFCKCSFLDGKDIDISIERDALGSDLFHSVCNYLNIKNKHMYGLVHKSGSYNPAYRWWVRMDKLLRKHKLRTNAKFGLSSLLSSITHPTVLMLAKI